MKVLAMHAQISSERAVAIAIPAPGGSVLIAFASTSDNSLYGRDILNCSPEAMPSDIHYVPRNVSE
jgi:hypothetical protein